MVQDIRSLEPPALRSLSWFDTWIRAVTGPSVANFEEIARDPGASLRRAYLWFALAVLISLAVRTVGAFLLVSKMGQGFSTTLLTFASAWLLPAVAPFFVWALLVFTLELGATHLIATRLGGVGTVRQIAYVLSAILAPLNIVANLIQLLYALPALFYYVTLLAFASTAYITVLAVTAVKAVYRLGWGSAVVAVLAAGVVAMIIPQLGPDLADIYSKLPKGLVTPAP